MNERTAKPASPTRLGMQSLRNIWQRLSVALMLVMLTMTVQTAGAQEDVSNAGGLVAAFNDPNVSEINVTKDITDVGDLPPLNRDLTINLNGHTISSDGLHFIVDPGCSLTINGEGQGGSVGNIISGYAGQNAIDNDGTVTLSHVNITTNSYYAILGGTLNIGNNVSFNGWTKRPFDTPNFNFEGGNYSGTVVATVTVGGKTHYFENLSAALDYFANNPGNDGFSLLGDTYTIKTAADWYLFCDLQEIGETFSGKTVKLDANIGTAAEPVTRMAGGSGHSFTGTFDGDGHTLTVQYGTPSEPVNQQFVAPFPVVEGAATFRNLTIAGSIYVDYTTTDENPQPGVGGLIGHLFGGVTIKGCTSTVEITSTRDRVGGFVGLCEHSVSFTDCVSSAVVHYSRAGNISGFVGWSRTTEFTISFEGCLFNGKLLLANGQWYGGGFVGWKGDGKTVNITNCLYAPPIAADEKYESGGATFCSQHDDKNPAVITNCYYTHTLGAAQGKQARAVTAGTDVTVAHAGVATHYATSGITAYKATGGADSDTFIAGLLYNNNVLYAGSDDVVSLTLSNTATGAAGYRYAGYTTNAGTLSGSTLTMPDEDVTVSPTLRSTGMAVPVTYVDADGNTQTHVAIALDGTETSLGSYGQETWYFVGLPTVAFDHRLTLNGDVHLILADGCTMNVTNSKGNGIDINVSLTIYGQTDGTGTLTVTSGNGIYTSSGTITISGGRVTATGGNGIYTNIGDITISGGRVTATGGNGISTNSGIVTLGCTNASDFIYVSSYGVGLDGTLKIADGQKLYDEDGNSYSGTLSYYEDILNGKTLRPLRNVLALYDSEDNSEAISGSNGQQRNVILYGRTLYKDGAWNTLCLPFDVELEGSPLDGATAKTVIGTTTSGNDLTINFGNPDSATEPVTVLKAGVPYIIKWDATNTNIVEPVFTGVTVVSSSEADRTVSVLDGDVKFVGYYDALSLDPAGSDDFAANVVPSIYYMTADNTLKHTGVARTLHTCRAYFQFDETDPNVGQSRQFILNFGDDATGVAVIDNGKLIMDNEAGAVYDLQGRKVNGQWSMVNGQWSMVN